MMIIIGVRKWLNYWKQKSIKIRKTERRIQDNSKRLIDDFDEEVITRICTGCSRIIDWW